MFIHALRWEVYKKDKEGLIKRYFWVEFTYPKVVKIVWDCLEDNIIK